MLVGGRVRASTILGTPGLITSTYKVFLLLQFFSET